MNKTIIRLLTVIFLLLVIMFSVGPADSLDKMFYYTGEEARTLLATFSQEDREAYFLNEIFDLFLIVTYTALFLTLKRHFFALVPGLFDLIETLAVLYTLKYAEPFKIFDLLGVVTALKWSTGVLFVLFWWWQRKKITPSHTKTLNCCGV